MSGLTCLGITSGIGSMMVGAARQGYEVLGNVEWRNYYHHRDPRGRNTFVDNFDRPMFHKWTDVPANLRSLWREMDIDLVFSHPECGAYSNLSNWRGSKALKEVRASASDIPLGVDLIAEIRPKIFLMDDLPKSLIGFPIEEYAKRLPEYDLYPEWISNWAYGNTQRWRKRFFMIGARKDVEFCFVPGEDPDWVGTVEEVLGDIDGVYGSVPNHERHSLKGYSGRGNRILRQGRPNGMTWKEIRDYLAKRTENYTMDYINKEGVWMKTIGFTKQRWAGPSNTLTGNNPAIHAHTNLPYSVRERARIQGFPDDFVFYGTLLEKDGTWNHNRNIRLVKQTGKAMPVQFCTYFSALVRRHLTGGTPPELGVRTLKPDPFITAAKRWLIVNRGYASDRAAECCWLDHEQIRMEA